MFGGFAVTLILLLLLLLLLWVQVSQVVQDPSRAYAFSSIQFNDKVSVSVLLTAQSH
jgi:glycopeptide antibiotics resistance protein